MPKMTQGQREERRQQILLAAYRCFSRRGFHSSTIRDVCAEAGLSAGGLYAHFASKDEIVEALAEAGRDNTRAFLEAVPEAADAPRSLLAILESMLTFLASPAGNDAARLDLRLWGEALNEATLRRLFQQGLENNRQPLERLVTEGQQRHELDTDLEPEAVVRVLIALYLGLSVQRVMDPEMDLEACLEVARALLLSRFSSSEESR